MQHGEVPGNWPESLEYDLQLARVCVDDILRAIPLHVSTGWKMHTLQDILGGAFPPDEYNYVFMGFALEPQNRADDDPLRPGILVRTTQRPVVYQIGSDRILNTPDSDPSKLKAYLSTRIGQTLYRFSRLQPIEDREELEIPVLYTPRPDSSHTLTLDFEAVMAMCRADQTLLLQFAAPLVRYILPRLSDQN